MLNKRGLRPRGPRQRQHYRAQYAASFAISGGGRNGCLQTLSKTLVRTFDFFRYLVVSMTGIIFRRGFLNCTQGPCVDTRNEHSVAIPKCYSARLPGSLLPLHSPTQSLQAATHWQGPAWHSFQPLGQTKSRPPRHRVRLAGSFWTGKRIVGNLDSIGEVNGCGKSRETFGSSKKDMFSRPLPIKKKRAAEAAPC